MSFVLAKLLHDPQVVDAGEEVPPRKVSDGLRG